MTQLIENLIQETGKPGKVKTKGNSESLYYLQDQDSSYVGMTYSMADAIINGKIQPKCTKAMDMRFHWLRDRECHNQFKFYWRPGKTNYADYWTKHHTAAHHVNIRAEFLTPLIVLEMLQQKTNARVPAAAAAQCTPICTCEGVMILPYLLGMHCIILLH